MGSETQITPELEAVEETLDALALIFKEGLIQGLRLANDHIQADGKWDSDKLQKEYSKRIDEFKENNKRQLKREMKKWALKL